MKPPEPCLLTYCRLHEAVQVEQTSVFMCTYLFNHDGGCSWADLQAADMAWLEEQTRPSVELDDVLSALRRGKLDLHLESILAAAHGRKREKRGIYAPHGLVGSHDHMSGRRTS